MGTLSTVNIVGILLYAMVGILLVCAVLGPIFDEMGSDLKSGKCTHYIYGVVKSKKTWTTTSGIHIYYIILDTGSGEEAYPVNKKIYKKAKVGMLTEMGIKDGKIMYIR